MRDRPSLHQIHRRRRHAGRGRNAWLDCPVRPQSDITGMNATNEIPGGEVILYEAPDGGCGWMYAWNRKRSG